MKRMQTRAKTMFTGMRMTPTFVMPKNIKMPKVSVPVNQQGVRNARNSFNTSGSGRQSAATRESNNQKRYVNSSISQIAGVGLQASGIDNLNQSLGRLAVSAGGLGVAFAGVFEGINLFKSSVSAAADFEQRIIGMSTVLKATGKQNFTDGIRDEVRQLGRDTILTANQVAESAETILKTDLKPEALVSNNGKKGALAVSTDLAVAAKVDSNFAAQTLGKLMAVYKLSGEDAVKASNLIMGSVNASTFGFKDISIAMGQSAAAAANAGVAIEDYFAILANTSSSFNAGSDAGTSLKVMMNRMVGVSKEAKKSMSGLGIIDKDGNNTFFDENKNMKDAAGLYEVLGKAMLKAGVSAEEAEKLVRMPTAEFDALYKSGDMVRNQHDLIAMFGKAFGMDAWRSAFTMGRNGIQSLNRTQKILKNTSTEAIAAEKLKGYNNQVLLLASAWNDFKLTLIDQAALDSLKTGIQGLTQFVKDLTAALPELKNTFMTVFSAIKDVVSGAVAVVKAVLKEANTVLENFGGFAKAAYEGFSDLVSALSGGAITLPELVLPDSWNVFKGILEAYQNFKGSNLRDDAIKAARQKQEDVAAGKVKYEGKNEKMAITALAKQELSGKQKVVDGYKEIDSAFTRVDRAVTDFMFGRSNMSDTWDKITGNTPDAAAPPQPVPSQQVVPITNSGNTTVTVNVDAKGATVPVDVGAIKANAEAGAMRGVSKGFQTQSDMTKAIVGHLNGA